MPVPSSWIRAACCLSLAVVLGAQSALSDTSSAETAADVAKAIRDWASDFEQGRLGPAGLLRCGVGLQPAYVSSARRADMVGPNDEGRLTHLDMLQKMLYFAEAHPTTELGDAVLGIAAARLETSFLDLEALQLREIGHWSLMRMDHRGVWYLLMRAAAGERVPVFSGSRKVEVETDENGLAVGPGRRVAALRLLGMKGLPVFRSTIEAALHDADPRVRLGAAEALDFQRRPESMKVVIAAIQMERHPVVSQALVRVMMTLLRTQSDNIDREEQGKAMAVALRQFGLSGWRTDMELLSLIEAHPCKEAIPTLIHALELAAAPDDPLLHAINKRASPMLRDKAAALLRGMTGALVPATDVKGWQEFWHSEQDRIVVPPTLPQDRPQTTRAQFFGVPVTGGSIAFVIDTSGSMSGAVAGTASSNSSSELTRLNAAKEQIVQAAQVMDPDSSYSLWTFADHAHLWNSTPIRPGKHTIRSLTELLSRFQPKGGTNLYDGLAKALQLGELKFGEQDATKIDELFVLSDGEPTTGEVKDADGLLQIVREANKYAKVKINCVFTGTGKGSDLLRRLAEENGGVFVQR